MEQFPEPIGQMNRSCFTGTPLAAFPEQSPGKRVPWTRGTIGTIVHYQWLKIDRFVFAPLDISRAGYK